jgi:TRAP-type C4-dicarboxylate transport system permease small subunit
VRALARLIDGLTEAAGTLAGLTTLALTALVAVSVVARRAFNRPLLITEEVSGYLVLAIVFLGLAYTLKSDGHVRVDVVLAHAPARVRRALETLSTLIGLVFAGLLLAGCWRQVAQYWSQGSRSFRYLETPLWIPGTFLVAGAALLVLQLLARLIRRGEA